MTSTRVRTPVTPAGRAKPVVEDGGNGEGVTPLDRTAAIARLAGADIIRFEENGRKARATRLLTSNSRKVQQMP